MKKSLVIGTLMLSATLLLTACGNESSQGQNNASSTSSSSSKVQSSDASTKQVDSSNDSSQDNDEYQTHIDKKFSSQDQMKAEYQAAFDKACVYAKMPMSEKGIYNQLTSYAEKFSPDEAKYALHYLYKVDVNWNDNALNKAKTYSSLGMSNDMIKTQLTSFAEGFTDSQAQYAISHLS